MAGNASTVTCPRVLIYNLPFVIGWFFAVYLTFLAGLTVVENITVIYSTLTQKRQLKTTMGKVFLSMAVVDLVTGLFVTPCYALLIVLNQSGVDIPCALHFVTLTMAFTVTTVSLLTLVFVSLNRLLAVLKPHLFRRRSNQLAWIVSFVITWVFSLILVFPPFLGAWSRRIFTLTFSITMVFSLVVPPVAYFYIFIYSKRQSEHAYGYRKRSTSSTAATNPASSKRYDNKQKRISKSCLVATIILLAMYLPQLIVRVLETIRVITSASMLEVIVIICNSFALTNSAVNPWIYARQNVRLRGFLFFKLLPKLVRVSSFREDSRSTAAKASIVTIN